MQDTNSLVQNFWTIVITIWIVGGVAIWLLPKRAAIVKKLLGLLIAFATTYLLYLKIGMDKYWTSALNELGIVMIGGLVTIIMYFILSVLADVHAHDK